MKFDLEELVIASARAVADKLTGDIETKIERAVTRVLDQRAQDGLLPLNKLKGGSAPAARMFLARHADLRSLGVKVGSRLLFRRSDWESWLQAHRTVAK